MNEFKKIARNYIFRIIILLIIILFATATTFILFPPWEKIPLEKVYTKEPIYISKIETPKPSFKTALADALQILLNLKWYDICFVNNNYYKKTDCLFQDEGSPFLAIQFREGNPEKYGKTTLDYLSDAPNDFGAYQVPVGERGCFTYLGEDGFSYRIYHLAGGSNCIPPENSMGFVEIGFDYDIYAKPNLVAWWAKFTLILLIWIVIVASLLTIWRLNNIKFINKK